MNKLTLKELQEIELNILIAFDKVCRDNEIKYSLGYGTLIGAVRHKGFIPWDDDIDVIMVRKEYEKFKVIAKKNKQILDKKYKVLFPSDDGYSYPMIKIIDTETVLYEKYVVREELGVWIDIFPIDYCAHSKKDALKIAKSQLRLCENYFRGRYRSKNDNLYNTMKNLLWLPIFRILNGIFKKRLLENEKHFSNNVPMKYMGVLVYIASLNNIYPAEYFEEYTVMQFENKNFMVFKRYDEILSDRYGNYMELPPESQRLAHDPEAYIRNT